MESSFTMKNGKSSKFPRTLEWLNCMITLKGNIQPLSLGHRRIYGNFGHICHLISILNIYLNRILNILKYT